MGVFCNPNERMPAFNTSIPTNIGDPNNVHPTDKLEVGKRGALLAAYDATVLNNCQDMVCPEGAPREALLDFMRNGKGIVAPHSAVCNFGADDLTELRKMMGGVAAGHPWTPLPAL